MESIAAVEEAVATTTRLVEEPASSRLLHERLNQFLQYHLPSQKQAVAKDVTPFDSRPFSSAMVHR